MWRVNGTLLTFRLTLQLDQSLRFLKNAKHAEERAMAGGCGDSCASENLSHAAPAYRRALWIVVLLNLAMGVAEMIGGFLAGSQALKADALDFLGDGVITLFGLLAIGWSLAWRARSALIQGLFQAGLGLGVIGTTIYRVFVVQAPEAEVMGVFGVIALAINVIAAWVLVPHSRGDANVRAIWLCSRNDALGNVAVLIAAGLVAWMNTPWPDLAVAAIIAGLFLHSAWEIITHARADLGRAAVVPTGQ